MELRHLRYFVTAAEELSISHAALRLHVSQPPLSRQIHDLEAEIGTALFDRSKKKLQITPAGECFLKEAKRILADVQRAAGLAQSVSQGKSVRLSVGLLTCSLELLLARVMRAFHKRFPLVDLNVSELTPQKQIDALRVREIDLGFVGKTAPDWERDLDFEPVRRVEMMVAFPSGHPLTILKRVPLSRLANEPIVFFKRSSGPGMYDWMRDLCRAAGFEPTIAKTTDQGPAFLEFVGAGFGIAFLPDWFQHYPSDVVFRSLTPKLEFQLLMTWRRNEVSPILKTFMKMVKEHFESDFKVSQRPVSRRRIRNGGPCRNQDR